MPLKSLIRSRSKTCGKNFGWAFSGMLIMHRASIGVFCKDAMYPKEASMRRAAPDCSFKEVIADLYKLARARRGHRGARESCH